MIKKKLIFMPAFPNLKSS